MQPSNALQRVAPPYLLEATSQGGTPNSIGRETDGSGALERLTHCSASLTKSSRLEMMRLSRRSMSSSASNPRLRSRSSERNTPDRTMTSSGQVLEKVLQMARTSGLLGDHSRSRSTDSLAGPRSDREPVRHRGPLRQPWKRFIGEVGCTSRRTLPLPVAVRLAQFVRARIHLLGDRGADREWVLLGGPAADLEDPAEQLARGAGRLLVKLLDPPDEPRDPDAPRWRST